MYKILNIFYQEHIWTVNDVELLCGFCVTTLVQRINECPSKKSNWTMQFVVDKFFTSLMDLLDIIEKRMGSKTIELLLMEPGVLGSQFMHTILQTLKLYNGKHKQKKALRDWLYRQNIRFDRVRPELDNILFYFSESDLECVSEGLVDSKIYTSRGFNPKICHYSIRTNIRKIWTEANLRVGIQYKAYLAKKINYKCY